MKKQQAVDFWLLLPLGGLIVFGLLGVYSATNGTGDTGLFFRQLTWAAVGGAAMLFVYYNDVRFFKESAYGFYILSMVMLVAVLVLGTKVAGQTSWVRIAGFSFQPSEIAKMATILALARFLSSDNTDINSLPHLVTALAIPLLPAVLIMLQPDMGTTLTALSFIAPMIIMAGFDIYILMLLAFPLVLLLTGFISIYALAGMAVVFLLVLAFQHHKLKLHQMVTVVLGCIGGLMANRFADVILKPHQLKRIQTFLDPMSDPQGAGYNVLQAKIAISSGGVFGKGFLEGTQTQLRFIPAQWTDFIFCVIAEEFGFIGASFLILLFAIVIVRLIWAIFSIKNRFVELTLGGFVSLLLVHVIINIGMTLGLIPVIGVPLPFVSYGGSSLVGNMIMVGLALNFFHNRRSLGY
ncbi:rod shape-determining protein RodA [Chlorobium phaeovibrioides]|uniref:Cell wall polymerase n=2 Tax=Chlorobium phaeovibrioides TaxID=1094 RepID=A0A432AWQ6_CHLPH|nr:rod shape-determining protein RodA [Chlorobium phaeovibrioides]HCD35978.1 rod shape-determining protein RodA [Chlorobium sp.]MWV54382.1 rod shape-determining protein RodA [Chlorobium phaeovibrioides]QEQ56494.1 rod shape-determining protein RodA [Chlorobium phaeovibrioides]RTY35772.1 rod shape-determining protein RodA [Chlorobium phaeovibrioides]RTY39086.1 rod shape-determining protein RodA [Chlorobium phaeovibrioides]